MVYDHSDIKVRLLFAKLLRLLHFTLSLKFQMQVLMYAILKKG